MANVKPTTAPSNPCDDAAEAGHGHRHHRLLHHHHHHHHQQQDHKAQPAPPPVATVNRFECSSDINDCSDTFIKHFRQQLELQRLQSIEKYQQMLARGL